MTVILANCLEGMAKLDSESVHAVVSDPPYGFEFMGAEWDRGVPGVPFWAEALRVAKPGAFLLAFGGTRTFHRLAVAIEDAGWEIRDTLSWLYGSGFPKSLDVSAAIEKRRDDEAEVRRVCRWLRETIDADPAETVRTIAERFGFHPRMVEHWAARDTDSQPTVPTLEQWAQLRDLLFPFGSPVDELVRELNERKGEFGEDWHAREVTGTHKPDAEPAATFAITGRDKLRRDRAATDAAARWQGWGTALKPAWEPIIVARKPLIGTVAQNVLAHGTGGLNIDGTRIPGERVTTSRNVALGSSSGGIYGGADTPADFESHAAGRWPANVILDRDAAALLDAQAPNTGAAGQAQGPTRTNGTAEGRTFGDRLGVDTPAPFYGDSGGASRFFYCAKASRSERDAGLQSLEAKAGGIANGSGRQFNAMCVNCGVRGDVCECGAFAYAANDGRRVLNIHPTVKPLSLMRWLVRLVTPKGGRILDPFAGSGTTGCAAALEGFDFVGFDLVADHVEIANLRIAHWRRVALDQPLDLFADYFDD